MYRIFDAHCHIYPEAIAQKAVKGIDRFYERLPFEPYDGTTGTLRRLGRESGISHFLVHSVATAPRQISSINRFIASEVAASDGAFTGLGTLHPDSGYLEQEFRELVGLGLKGVKLHPDFQHFEADSVKAMRIYELCADAGLPVLVHTGDHRFDYSNPNRIAAVLRAFPKLKFVGAHFGGWSVWDDAVRTLSDFDNIVVDTSSTFYALGRDRCRELIRQWGVDRVMFGTDYPMWHPQPEIDCMMEMEWTEDEYRRLFWDNAARVFGPEADPAQ
ncbi:MAG: amidohydrolase [Clostridiales bacterium]|nr:amidohydrolase [Clostridiales bacterium]